MKLQFAFLIVVLLAGASRADNAAALGQFPWHAYLWMTDDSVTYRYCDGGLIRHNWVLTSAHCIFSSIWIYVRVGGVDVFEGFEAYTYVEYMEYKFMYENYNLAQPHVNDIGLIYLYDMDASILASPNIALIPLPAAGDTNLVGLSSTITGFGVTVDNPWPVLRHITFPVLSEAECTLRHGSYPNTICTNTDNDESPCLEDSGGALTAVVGGSRVVIGIGSTVAETCVAGHHGVFTRVTAHLTWINQRIATSPPPPPSTPAPEKFAAL